MNQKRTSYSFDHFVPAAAPFSTKMNTDFENARRSVTYHSAIWGDHFLAYADLDVTQKPLASEEEEILAQIGEVRKMFAADDSLIRKLDLIDAIQRLGVGYHFEKEIDESLLHIYELDSSDLKWDNSNLRATALRFRLLRQHGYCLSCDVFKQFMHDDGKFERSLITDPHGLLSLYEAAHFGVHGEKILDEALDFCTKNLQSILLHTNNSLLVTQIEEALNSPIHRSLIIYEVKKFMSTYQEKESHNKTLLKFAKMNFNLWQKMVQKELSDITKWWKDLDAKTKWPFARDRVTELYIWILGFIYEPQYRLARKITSKVVAMISVIDDIYDVQGTLDELQSFTDAILRWDNSASDQLPSYMRACYEALLDVYDEMELELGETSLLYRVNFVKEEMKKLVKAYMQEAKWLYSNHVHTMEEYMKVALESAAYNLLNTCSLVGMGNIVSKEDFEWITSEPLVLRASSTIARLLDDMAGYGFEQKISAVDCYMKETVCSKDEVFDEFKKRVWTAWKDINQECLRQPTPAPIVVIRQIVNSTRVLHLVYRGEQDSYTNSKSIFKNLIKTVLVEPLSI
ncbi:beta-caryophyllene synthase-like isoform X3 [Henckelia pumila]|uniref:beta-caryophyllene synthase-like isoform X3 n=1 Tax=Henckelia pumila TaxID=405737 RepID=UPI003C6E4B24